MLPKCITDLFVREKLGCRETDIDENRDETEMKNLNAFDPRIESHRAITLDALGLIRNMQLINEELILLKKN